MMIDNRNHCFVGWGYTLALGIALACAVRCYGTSNGGGSGETHFLRSCSDGAKCADGLQCVCGVCTVRCDENDTCKEQSELASCMPSDCSEQRTCDVECAKDRDCVDLGSKYRCEDGRCRVAVTVSQDAEKGDNGDIDGGIGDNSDIDAGSSDSGRTVDSDTGDEKPGAETCDLEDGQYQAVYEKLKGTCELPSFNRIPISFRYSEIEKWHFEEIDSGLIFLTDIIYQGCALEITQEIRRDDILIFGFIGTVEIESVTRLSGTVLIGEFGDDFSLTCEGTYDVILTKTAELYDDIEPENISCPPGCRLITAYPITDCVDYSTDLPEAERNVACDCGIGDPIAVTPQCHLRLSDNSAWLFGASMLANPDAWGECAEEQMLAVLTSCEFQDCERPPMSTCSRSDMCEVRDCGGLQIDDQGCMRASCESDGDCKDDERCIAIDCLDDSWCESDPNGRCQCFTTIDACVRGGVCNPVQTVGPRGEWERLEIIEGPVVFCPPEENCEERRTITPDGRIEFDKYGETGSTTVSEAHLAILERAIDGPELRVALRDGIECDEPLDGYGVRLYLELDSQTLERTIHDCAIAGPEGNIFWSLYQIVTSY